MKIVTSVTVFDDSVGKRMSMTYSEIDGEGQIIADNKRVDKVVTDSEEIQAAAAVKEIAQNFVDSL